MAHIEYQLMDSLAPLQLQNFGSLLLHTNIKHYLYSENKCLVMAYEDGYPFIIMLIIIANEEFDGVCIEC